MTAEGVIKFELDYHLGPEAEPGLVADLNAWRRVLYQLDLIGQDPARYGGLGFGNLSCRLEPYDTSPYKRRFLVSGTQTGRFPHLDGRHYVVVETCAPERNHIVAQGPIRPSSESLTHGALYALDPDLRAVMHVHSPQLWLQAKRLGLPSTPEEIAYGTPEMARAVADLYRDPRVRSGNLLAMAGHEDGLLAFGPDLVSAGLALVQALAGAYALAARG